MIITKVTTTICDGAKQVFKKKSSITTPKYSEECYKLLAIMNVIVITPDKLTEMLDGKFGRVKRA
jgi:hypothetical protein